MKLMITTAAIALAAVSASAAAQSSYPGGGSSTTQQLANQASQNQQQPEAQQQQSSVPTVKPSNKAAKAIIDLQNAVKANDVANIPAKIAAAQAVAQTKEDRYLIALFQGQAAAAAKDNVAYAAAVETIVGTGVLDTPTVAKLYLDLGAKQYNANQFAQSVASFQHAASLTPNDPETLELLAQAMARAGQNAEAAGAFQRAIQARLATGQKPEEAIYHQAALAAFNSQSPSAPELAQKWLAAYPSATSWRDSIAIFRNQTHQDVEGTLDLLRLMQAAGAMATAGDYALFAESAAGQSNFTEAQAVVDAGIAAHVVDPSSVEFRDIIAGLKSKPKTTAADLEAATKMSPSPINLLRIGDRYYGMGEYAKAADTYRQVLSKPGADKDLANLHLGMALARAGDKAGATAALNAVSGARAGIAKFWLLYVQQHA